MAPKKAKEQIAASAPKTAVPVQKREPGLHIIAMQVENVKRVKLVRIRPATEAGAVIIAGENGSGKSSVLDSIDYALCGTTNVPSKPIRKGERVGMIEIDLGEYKVRRTFTQVDGGEKPFLTKLEVFGKNREKYPNPQTLLNGMMGAISFDPLEFTRLEPKKQLAMMRQLVTFDVDIDALEAEKKTAYDERRDVGRDLEAAKNLLAVAPKPAPDTPETPIDTAALTVKLTTAGLHNDGVAERERVLDRLKNAVSEDEKSIARKAQAIDECEAMLVRLRSELATLETIKAAGQKQVDEYAVGVRIDTAEVAQELQAAQTTNADVQRGVAFREKEKRVNELQEKWAGLDKTVKEKEDARAAAIAAAKMPIDGLSIGDDEILFEGLPFDQASNAQQISISVAMAMAGNPKLRVMRIKDGSLLDTKTLKLISTLAAAEDYQVFIERVDTAGEVGVLMEDGEGSGSEVEKVSK